MFSSCFLFHFFGQLKEMSFQQVFLLISIDCLLSSVRVILGEVGRGVVVCAGGFGKLSLAAWELVVGLGRIKGRSSFSKMSEEIQVLGIIKD